MSRQPLIYFIFMLAAMFSLTILLSGCGGDDEDSGGIDAGPQRDAGWQPAPDSGIEDAGVGGDITWIPIAGGAFDMGVDHPVTLSAFDILETEVTVFQYAECVADDVCKINATDAHCNWNGRGLNDHPINCTSWQQAAAYCIWAGGRLPTESEWEYAARSQGEDNTYPWGEAAASCDYAVMNTDGASAGCDTDRTSEVCSKPNGNTVQGLCDMAGNVLEWMLDKYQADYANIPTDGSAYEAAGTERVVRGGSLSSFPSVFMETRTRQHNPPSLQETNIGFRCARDAE
jgi:formylglycine-generating enzyme required for sulfatase activity